MRKLLHILLVLTILGATAATVFWFLHQRLLDGREKRIAELQIRLDDLRTTERLNPQQACLVAEHYLLSRPIGRALRVTCGAPRLDGTGVSVVKLSGLIYASSVEQSLFGGGFLGTLCLARTVDGWAVVGDAYSMNDCRFTVPAGAQADEVVAFVARALAKQRRVEAERAITLIRQTLAGANTAPESCTGLEAVSPRQLGLVDTDLLAKAPSEQQLYGWGHLTTGAIQACLKVGVHATRPQDCRLDEPWRYVLVFDQSDKQPPVQSNHSFSGGVFRTTLRLIDMRARRVICARPATFRLDDKVLTTHTRSLREIYRDGVDRTICREVQAMSQGILRLDRIWLRCR